MSCAFAGTKIAHEILLCVLAPRGDGEDPRARVGHLRVRSTGTYRTRIGRSCGAGGGGLASLDRGWGERGSCGGGRDGRGVFGS